MTPDPRVIEDVIEAGVLALRRAERTADDTRRHTVREGADWLLKLTRRELRPEVDTRG